MVLVINETLSTAHAACDAGRPGSEARRVTGVCMACTWLACGCDVVEEGEAASHRGRPAEIERAEGGDDLSSQAEGGETSVLSRACVHACMRACVRVCVRVCVRACAEGVPASSGCLTLTLTLTSACQ
eukprot:scaffold75094_cov47-Phaeocystis_antarctica.AAC.1